VKSPVEPLLMKLPVHVELEPVELIQTNSSAHINKLEQSAMEITQPQVKSIMEMLQDTSGERYRKFFDVVNSWIIS
jgi:hypothetical protein